MADRQAIGKAGEQAAADFLETLGYRIVGRNVRFRSGEIDLVAYDRESLVFVEVKTRSGRGFGTPAEAVTHQKRQRLVRLAQLYIIAMGHELRESCRFDVVSVEPDALGKLRCVLIRDAFSA